MSRPLAAVLVLLSATPRAVLAQHPSLAAAQEFALQQLACRKEPNPTPLLAFLARQGYIRPRYDVNIDSVFCWRLLKPFSISGLPVTGVCGFDEEQLVQEMQPGLYSRGPGTSPGTRLTVITSASVERTRRWSAAADIKMRSRVEPNEAFPRLGGTEVTCTMSMVEPQLPAFPNLITRAEQPGRGPAARPARDHGHEPAARVGRGAGADAPSPPGVEPGGPPVMAARPVAG